MINNNTLRKLNSLGIGADINLLESYIIDYKQSLLLSDMSEYEYEYDILYKMLKEIKGDSEAFKESTLLEAINNDEYDKYIDTISSYNLHKAYSTADSIVDNAREYMSIYGNQCDIMAMPNVLGIKVNCIYLNGYVYRIYAIGNNHKYMDLTKLLKSKVKGYIEEFKDTDIVELRGTVTILDNFKELQDKSLNVICSTMRCIRTKTNIDKLHIIFNDMICDNSDTLFNNNWDKLEYMRDIGISVPHHGLLINIDKEIIQQALIELDDYFINIKNTDGILYRYSGIEVRFNNDTTRNDEGWFIYISDKCNTKTIYKSTIKSV
ncbi:MAG: hypothetical protein J6A59_10920, partial [Lachnospiraceae bacterium]|nr:hypothetical protein [Lachnospiraceae bacterium]